MELESEAFEFPSSGVGHPAAICIAGDVISGGKLLPFGGPPAPAPARIGKRLLQHVGGGGARINTGGYRKLHKEPEDPIRSRKTTRWYMLAFGSVRVQSGMEYSMKEIRIRQQRNSSSSSSPNSSPKEKKVWGPWKLLRSLSCRGVEVAGDCHRRIVL